MQSTINQRLKILFEELNMKPAQMARVLGISPSTLHNYTDRESKPGYDVLEKLFYSFEKINLYWLFGKPGAPLLADDTEPPGSIKIIRGQMVGKTGRDTIQNQYHGGTSDNEQAMQRELELLRSQLADKERTIQILLGQKP